MDLEKDVDLGTDTDTDTDTSEETNVGRDGGAAIRISPSHKENRTGCDNKRPKSQVQCYRVCRTVEGSVWPAYPSYATCEAAVPHVLEKTSASNERYHSSTCSCGHTGDRVCKEIQDLATQIVPLPPPPLTVPRHDRPSQNGATSTVCVFPSLVTSESLGSHFTCDQRREHDATVHDTHSI